MKIVLVFIHIADSRLGFPLAGGLLKTALLQTPGLADWDVKILNFSTAQSQAELMRSIAAEKPAGVGFSLLTWNLTLGLETARLLKAAHPQRLLFAGGPQVTAEPAALWNENIFSFLVIGEGESSLPRALAQWAVTEHISSPLTGIYTGRELSRSPAVDPNALPSAHLSGYLNPEAYPAILWEMSRGCPYACAFCYESRGEHQVRRLNNDRLAAELAFFMQQGVEDIWVLDPTFNHDKQRAKELLIMLIESECAIHFTFEIRAEKLDEEMAELFAQLDCSLQIGLQTIDPRVLKTLNRRLDPDQFRQKCALLSQWDIPFGLDLIYGLPGDTYSGFCASLQWALVCRPLNLDIFPLAILPGTALADKAQELGLQHTGAPAYQVTMTPEFPPQDLALAARLAECCEYLYNKGYAVLWFATLTEALGMQTVELLNEFAAWREVNAATDFYTALFLFLKPLFASHKVAALFPAIKSLILYLEALNRIEEEQDCSFLSYYTPEELDNLTCLTLQTFCELYGNGEERLFILRLDAERLQWEAYPS